MDAEGAIGLLLGVLGVVPTVAVAFDKALRKSKGLPSAEDSKALVEFCARLDTRRVFSAPFNAEVVDLCIASISHVKDDAEALASRLQHPLARTTVLALLDDLRAFLDTWGGGIGAGLAYVHRYDRDEAFSEFFKDLGSLRERVRLWIAVLANVDPKVRAPKLTSKRGH